MRKLLPYLLLSAGLLSAQTYTTDGSTIPANTLVGLNSASLATPLGAGGTYAGISLASSVSGQPVNVTTNGTVSCVFENNTTPGDLVILGTSTFNDCRDSGQTAPSGITGGTRILGVVTSAVSSGSAAPVTLGRLDAYGTNPSGGGGSSAFSAITPGTNTGALVIGAGGSLAPAGGGTVSANQVNGAVVPASAACLSTNGGSQILSATCLTGGTAAGGDASGTLGALTINKIHGATVPSNAATVGTNSSGQIVPVTPLGQVATQDLSKFLNAADFSNRKVAYLGNSTVWNAQGWFTTIAANTFSGVLANLPTRNDLATASTDASSNITVVLTNPVTYQAGQFVTLQLTAGGAIYASSCGAVTGVIASVTTNSFTFPATNGSSSCPSVSSIAVTGFASTSLLNFGNNGQTSVSILANTSPTGTGIGGVCAANPDFVIIRGPIINDVRQGAANLAVSTTDVANVISAVNACLPTSRILLKTENSFLSTDPGAFGFVTMVSTTTTGAIASTGVQTVALAQIETSMYLGGQVAVDAGGSLETVTITGMTGTYPSAGTITATFANTHSSGVAVVATLASASQAYSVIIKQAVDAQINQYPNVVVVDTQNLLWGNTVQATNTYMANQIHPGTLGQIAEAVEDLNLLTQIAGVSTYQTPVNVDPVVSGFPAQAAQIQVSPYLAQNALAQSYTNPYPTYPHTCAYTKYYDLVVSGIAAGFSTNTLAAGQANFQIGMPSVQFPVIQNGDVFEQQSAGCWSVASLSASAGSGTVLVTLNGGATTPFALVLKEQINVWRPKYYSAAAEPYLNNKVTYPYRRRIIVGAGGTNFFQFSFLPSETNASSTASPITASDVLVLSTAGVQALTGCSLTFSSANHIQCAVTGSFAALANQTGWVFGNHPLEPNSTGHIYALGFAGTVAAGAGISTTPTVAGNDTDFTITIPSTAVTVGAIATVTFKVAYTAAPRCSIQQSDTSTNIDARPGTSTTTTIPITANTANATPAAYTLIGHCAGQ